MNTSQRAVVAESAAFDLLRLKNEAGSSESCFPDGIAIQMVVM